MKKIKNTRQGMLFTLAIVLLLVPLVLLTSFYGSNYKTRSDETTEQIRCDELHYFFEDVNKDLGRAVEIFGRRAAIYALDYVIRTPGNPLENYTFNCSTECEIDCNRLTYPKTGAEAAIAELSLCGTLNGTNVTYMINHTLKEWKDRIEMRGADKNFHVNITLREIAVVPRDPWTFSIVLDNRVDIVDEAGICYFRGTSVQTISNSSIEGLEDPVYTLNTDGKIIKYIYDCDPLLDFPQVVGNGTLGDGGGTMGTVFRYSLNLGNVADLENYCTDTDADVLASQVLVLDIGGGISCNYKLEECTSMNSTKHFGAVIDENPNTLNCNITVPWVSDTGNINITDGECVFVRNDAEHIVLKGINCSSVNYSCYQPSNISHYTTPCVENISEGASFLDRLDGRLNLSEKYKNQSLYYFNNSVIGLESFVDLTDIVEHTLTPVGNVSWIDYLYWQNTSGEMPCGVCGRNIYPMALDCPHAYRYGLRC